MYCLVIFALLCALSLCLYTSLSWSQEKFPELPPEAIKEPVYMFFGSPRGNAYMWDTWVFHNDGTYYLFWLDAGKSDPDSISWESHAMAVSQDGVHWQHKGEIYRKKEGVVWLGTGHTWRSPDFANNGKFINNYSEWHKEKGQDIHFAESTDLLNWKKVDEKYRFVQDTRWYQEYGRWDCIDALPRPGGGLYGFWTASPDLAKVPGAKFGFGESLDGITWKALKPPVVKGLPESTGVEVGGAHKVGDTYYIMLSHGFIFRSKSIHGPYEPQPKNFNLYRGKLYFPRFLHNHPDGLMTNCHLVSGRGVRFAPLKRVIIDDEGIMRAVWWEGNEALKHFPLEATVGNETTRGTITLLNDTFPAEDGVLFEGQIVPGAKEGDAPRGIYFDVNRGDGFAFTLYTDRIEFGRLLGSGNTSDNKPCLLENGIPFPNPFDEDYHKSTGWDADPSATTGLDRGITFPARTKIRILAKEDCLEVYCNDHMMLIQRIVHWNGRIGLYQPAGKDFVKIDKAFSAGSPPTK